MGEPPLLGAVHSMVREVYDKVPACACKPVGFSGEKEAVHE
jgi:hypothetical protein